MPLLGVKLQKCHY